jgi:hypothetical protein
VAGDPRSPAADPLAPVEALLARAESLPAGAARDEALARALDALPAAAERPEADGARAEAYRAEILSRLARPREAAAAYARVVLAVAENAEAAHRGLVELIVELGGSAEALDAIPAVRARHPGRTWQWDALAADARKRLRAAAEAPLSPAELARLREDVAKALAAAPCRHDDDSRPRTAAAAVAAGLDAPRVLAWLSDLGACGCDCSVVAVRGPLEARTR